MRSHGLTDPVIALRRRTDYQFSPNWLSGAEDELSQPRFRSRFAIIGRSVAGGRPARWYWDTTWAWGHRRNLIFYGLFFKHNPRILHQEQPSVPAASFDHLIGDGENARRDGDADSLG